MGDSSEGLSSDEDEFNPDEYEDEYNPDENEYNRQSSGQTLKVFYWTTGLGAALLAICASSSSQIISSIFWVVATLTLCLAISPTSTVVSAHQWIAGGVTRGVRGPGRRKKHHCNYGKKSCKGGGCKVCQQCFNEFPREELQERLEGSRGRSNAKVQARRKKQATASDAVACPWVDTSDEALSDAAANGFATIQSYLAQHRNADNSGRPCMINVFDASTGTEGNTIEEEGMRSTLTTRGYDIPVLAVWHASWRTLATGQPRVQV